MIKDVRARARDVFEQAGFRRPPGSVAVHQRGAIAATLFRLADGVPTNAAPIVTRVAVPGRCGWCC